MKIASKIFEAVPTAFTDFKRGFIPVLFLYWILSFIPFLSALFQLVYVYMIYVDADSRLCERLDWIGLENNCCNPTT